jgi:hypothetical protein
MLSPPIHGGDAIPLDPRRRVDRRQFPDTKTHFSCARIANGPSLLFVLGDYNWLAVCAYPLRVRRAEGKSHSGRIVSKNPSLCHWFAVRALGSVEANSAAFSEQ